MCQLIAQQFQISRQNDFALLDHIGGECAGAVTFMESRQRLMLPATGGDIEWLGDDDFIAMLDELPRRPMLAGKEGLHLSSFLTGDYFLKIIVDYFGVQPG